MCRDCACGQPTRTLPLHTALLQSNDAGAVSDAVDGILGMKLGRENLRGGERPEPSFRGGARGEAEFRMLQAIENNDACAFEAAVGLALVRMPRVLSVLLLFSAWVAAKAFIPKT